MLNVLYVLNVLLMVIAPLLLGVLIRKRLGSYWRLFIIGGATFIGSQIAHIPFNYFLFSGLQESLNSLSEPSRLLWTALFVGLSAGLFEEGARYLTYRFWVRDARTWSSSLMLGAGHGGIEAILLGIIAGLNLSILIGYQHGFFTDFVASIGEEQVLQAIDSLYYVPWYRTLFGGLERIFALGLQLSLSVIVLQVFTRGNKRWLLIAFGWHALIDALSTWVLYTWGAEIAEIVVGVFAVFGLVIIFRLRKSEPLKIEPEPLREKPNQDRIELEITSDKLDNSRYSS